MFKRVTKRHKMHSLFGAPLDTPMHPPTITSINTPIHPSTHTPNHGLSQTSNQTPIHVSIHGASHSSIDTIAPSAHNEDPQVEVLSVDEMLERGVGQWGRGQQCHVIQVSLPWISEALQALFMVFAEKVPSWRCVTNVDKQFPLTCSTTVDFCTLRHDQWEWVDAKESTVSEFGLICDDSWKAALVGSLFFLGFLIGSGIFGSLSDGVLGRKRALFLCSTIVAVFGLLSGIAPSYLTYIFSRFGVGIGAGGLGLVSFVLGSELIGPKFRGHAGIITQYFFAVGIMVLASLAAFITHWRILAISVAAPSALFLLLFWTIDDSPRWLLVHSKTEEAMSVLRKLAKRNGTRVPCGAVLQSPVEPVRVVYSADSDSSPAGVWLEAKKVPEMSATAGDSEGLLVKEERESLVKEGREREKIRGKIGAWELFQIGVTRKWILVSLFNWFTVSSVYYGLSLNAGNLGSNLYVSSFLNGLVEIPSYILIGCLLDRVGRRLLLSFCLFLGGVACLGGVFIRVPDRCMVPEETCWEETLNVVCALIGKFGIAAAFCLAYIYTAEIFPTDVRNAALGLCSQAARVAGIFAPQLARLASISSSLPFVLFASLALTAGGLTLLLPETSDRALCETMETFRANDFFWKETSGPEKFDD